MVAEFQTGMLKYVITDSNIYQSFPQVTIGFHEITHIEYKEDEAEQGGKLMIYGNNKVIYINYKPEHEQLVKQLIKEIKQLH